MLDSSRHHPQQLLALTSDELLAHASSVMPRGHGIARRIHRQAVLDGRFEPTSLGVGPSVDAAWREHFALDLPTLAPESNRATESTELGTTVEKLVLREVGATGQKLEWECVLVPRGRSRSSLCISSQIGCRMACRFCETGRMGLLRQLTADEIVAQVVVARSQRGWCPESIVYQGMGEALDNFEALAQSLRVFTDRAGLGYAADKITVCTAGHVTGIRLLAALGYRRLNLSLSLNAADDQLRGELMPIGRIVGRDDQTNGDLAELQTALIDYRQRANLMLGIHYCLLPGINDQPADARAIARFCRPLGRVMVHLIPFNPGSGEALTTAPTEAGIEDFVGWLRAEGLPVRRRITKGRSVMAACGQLGNLELRRRQRASS